MSKKPTYIKINKGWLQGIRLNQKIWHNDRLYEVVSSSSNRSSIKKIRAGFFEGSWYIIKKGFKVLFRIKSSG